MSAPSYHPRWCRQELCTDTLHRGRMIAINSADDSHTSVTVQLIQPRTRYAAPTIILAGDMGLVALSLRQGRAVQYTTRTLLRAAERTQRATVPVDQPDRGR